MAAGSRAGRAAAAELRQAASGAGFTFNFQDTEIQAVVRTIAQLTGRNFLLDPRVKGKVTISSSRPVSRSAAYEIFLAALKAEGLAAVEGPGGVTRIVPEGQAKSHAEFSTQGELVDTEAWVTRIVPVQFASASQLATLLRPLLDPHGALSVYQPANALIISAPASGIRKLTRIIESFDGSGGAELTVLSLKHASAADLVQLIGRLPESQLIAENRLTLVPDLRTNSLLLHADSPARLEAMRSLIVKLDVPARPEGQTRVVYLRYADASKLAEVLKGLLGASRAPAAPGAASASETVVWADESANALVISASDAAYNNLRGTIDKLDVPRAQVFVEALIVEISADRAAQFGVQWAGARDVGEGALAGAMNVPGSGVGILQTAIAPKETLASANGLTLGFLGNKITLPDGTRVAGLGALARALEQESKANILSTPNLITLDNSEAKIVIGQNVPFLTGRFAQAAAGNGVNPFQTIERKDVGLTLKIKPQISEGGDIKLQIFQEVSSVVLNAVSAQDLITNKRSLETTVSVEDGHMIILGGLIQDIESEGIAAVPLLSRIPLLGALFKFRDRKRSKLNLMVFLRPVILRSSADYAGLTRGRYEDIRAEKRKSAGRIPMRWPQPDPPEWSEPAERPRPGGARPAPDDTAEPSPLEGSPSAEP